MNGGILKLNARNDVEYCNIGAMYEDQGARQERVGGG
jgi:hypothetical protein